MENDKQINNFRSVLGAIGLALIAWGGLKHFGNGDMTGYGAIMIGFALTNDYIYILEKKVDVSKKITWIKLVIVGMALLSAYYTYKK